MGTTQRSESRQRLSEAIGDWSGSLTVSGAGTDGTYFVDSALPDFTEQDDALPYEWVLVTSGGNSDEARRIAVSSGYVASTTTVTVSRSFSTIVATDITYELSRIDPAMKHAALARAAEEIYPSDGKRGLYLPVFDETLVIDNRLTNWDFETFDGTDFTGWTAVGSPTLTTDTSIKMHGAQSASVEAAAGGTDQLTQTLTINVKELTNKNLELRVMAYTTGTDAARVGIDWDGGTTIDWSAYHTGTDEFQDLSVSLNPPGTATQVQVLLETSASQTVKWDMASLVLGKINRYTVPTTIVNGPQRVEMQAARDLPNGEYYPMGPQNMPVPGRIMRLRGMGLLSRPSTDSGTIEIDGARHNAYIQYAAGILYEMMAGRAYGSEKDDLLAESRNHFIRASGLLNSAGIGMRSMSAELPSGVWAPEEDGTTREIVLRER